MSVGKEIEVLAILDRTFGHPFAPVGAAFHKDVAPALVHHGPAVAGQDARLHGVVVVDFLRTLATVQCAGGAHEVARCIGPGGPGNGFSAHAEACLQVVGRKGAFSGIGEREVFGLDGDGVAFTGNAKGGHRQVAVHDGQGGMVFKLCLRGPFHADEPVCEYRKTCIAGYHLGAGSGYGVVLCSGAHGNGEGGGK